MSAGGIITASNGKDVRVEAPVEDTGGPRETSDSSAVGAGTVQPEGFAGTGTCSFKIRSNRPQYF